MSRTLSKKIKRLVVKLGSGTIAHYYKNPCACGLASLIEEIGIVQKQGIQVVLVSSGSIVLGLGEINQTVRPAELSSLQALAAIGQNVLMNVYTQLLEKNKLRCAQILLTWDDFSDRVRYNNARNTIGKILDYGMIPIINENDTISTEEIKFGDNDKLSALVATLMGADLLLILSDVDGLYDTKSTERKVFCEIKDVTKDVESLALGTSKKNVSKGGMITKLEAVKIVTHANIPCIIANAQAPHVIQDILKGEHVGTLFVEKEEKLLARRHWVSFVAKPKGKIVVDAGAKQALLKAGKSLLLPGVLSWEGTFKKDDVVVILSQEGQEIGRGITNYSVSDLFRAEDKKQKIEVIHRDDMVLSAR